jgi:hypothetical protein
LLKESQNKKTTITSTLKSKTKQHQQRIQ